MICTISSTIQTHHDLFRGFLSLLGRVDDAAADANVFVVKDDRLARCDRTLRFIEADFGAAVVDALDFASRCGVFGYDSNGLRTVELILLSEVARTSESV